MMIFLVLCFGFGISVLKGQSVDLANVYSGYHFAAYLITSPFILLIIMPVYFAVLYIFQEVPLFDKISVILDRYEMIVFVTFSLIGLFNVWMFILFFIVIN